MKQLLITTFLFVSTILLASCGFDRTCTTGSCGTRYVATTTYVPTTKYVATTTYVPTTRYVATTPYVPSTVNGCCTTNCCPSCTRCNSAYYDYTYGYDYSNAGWWY